MISQHPPDRWLLLYGDRSDPVASIVLRQPERFGRDVVAIHLDQLLDEVEVGAAWRWRDRVIEPARTAVIHRLGRSATPSATFFDQCQLWLWLHRELLRFAYASSLPTATSPIGCHGSLLDQWTDLPDRIDGLRVPEHRKPWADHPLLGDVHRVDPWHLYSFGVRGASSAPDGLLEYVKPRGRLVHVAQVGALVLFANAPPDMTRRQQSYIVSFAHAMAARSGPRILEHAFFLGDDVPVFYSTCPTPVISGGLPEYADLLVRGLQDDIRHRDARLPS